MKKTFLILLTLLATVVLVSCSDNKVNIGDDNFAILDYPDFTETPGDKNSWEYLDPSEELTINWYVDISSWPIPTGMDSVSEIIKEKTGITVIFDTPVVDDGQKLATMIAGGDLPDVITVATSKTQTITGLAQQGYVYDINTLANKWAPTLNENLPKDVWEWWEYGNGKTYGIPNHYYSYEDIPNEQLAPNSGMMVREDIFDAWQNHVERNLKDANGMVKYKSLKGLDKSVEWEGYITTPEGFKEAAKWAMQNYSSSLTTGLQLSQFRLDGNASLNALAQFFAVPFEDEDGNYLYRFTEKGYEDMLYYLNDLFNEGLISPANFTQDYDGIGTVIASGEAFASLVTPQDYQMHFVTAKDSGYKYKSMYITNEYGDAPILEDIRGYGYLFNMITTNAKRPDIIVKLFDFLTSKEGQNLVTFGPEGETWNFGGKDNKEIVYTENYLAEKLEGKTAKYGMMQFDLLINYQYYDNVQPKVNHGKTEAEIFRTNLKRPLTQYSYDLNALNFVVDATDKRFQTYINNNTRIEQSIATQLPKIIRAKNKADSKKMYDDTVKAITSRGLDVVVEMNNEAFKRAKDKLGIVYANPVRQEGYINPLNRKEPNGDFNKYRGY